MSAPGPRLTAPHRTRNRFLPTCRRAAVETDPKYPDEVERK